MLPIPSDRLRRTRGPERSGDPRGPGRAAGDDQQGFILLESLVSITLLTIIMAALTTFVVTVTNSTTYQRQRQAAVTLANSTLEQARGLTASDLYLGRTATATSAQFSTASAVVGPWLTTMTPTSDPTATTTSTPTLAVTTPTTLNGTRFTSTSYLGTCSIPTDTSQGTSCTRPAAGTTPGYVRAVVAVTWPGNRCVAGVCTYVSSTLLSTADDPVFALRGVNATPTAAPTITRPADQVSVVGDAAGTAGANLPLQLRLDPDTGVDPATWQATGLPAGLTMSTSGLVSGSPTTAAPAATVTVTVTDAFLRTATQTFAWTVYGRVVGTVPADRSTQLNAAAVPLQLAATGGLGAPYTWTDPTTSLPPGLAIGTDSRITGTPTAPGSYPVTLTVTDKGGRTGTVAFTWTVTFPPPTATSPARTSTVTSTVSTQFTASGGSGGPYTWTDPTGSLPAGLTVNSGGLVTGTPTVVGAKAVKLRVTDSRSGQFVDVPFTWTIAARPAVDGLVDPFQTSRGATITAQALPYTCPTASCTLTLSGAPAGIGIAPDTTSTPGTVVTVTATSGTVYLRGTVATAATLGGYGLTVTPLDTTGGPGGTAGPPDTAAWTVLATPAVSGLTTPFRSTAGAAVTNQTLTYTCPSGACTLTLTGLPGLGIGLSTATTGTLNTAIGVTGTSGSAYLRGTVPAGTAPGTYTVTVTPTDTATGVAGPASQATWTVLARPTVAGLATSYAIPQGSPFPSVTLPFTCPSASCRITLTGAPAGLGLSPDTTTTGTSAAVDVTTTTGNVYARGTAITGAQGTYAVAVVATDSTTATAGTGTTTTLTVLCSVARQAAYSTAVRADAPFIWYRLGDTAGTTAADSGSANLNGAYAGGPTLGVPGALACDPTTAVRFNGSSSQVVSTAPAQPAPNTFSLEAWFSTTVAGGKIVGFGNSQGGSSSQNDRQLYLGDTGQVLFGIYDGTSRVIASPRTYLDGNYHHVVATLSPTAAMVLYVDGVQVATSAATNKSPNGYQGWLRVGYDNTFNWPGLTNGRYYFNGSLDEVAAYLSVLTPAQVAAHYNADQ